MEILSLQQIRHRATLTAFDDSAHDRLLSRLSANPVTDYPMALNQLSADEQLNLQCTKLTSYLNYQDEAIAFNEELKSIIPLVEDVNDMRIRNWCLKAKYLFNEVFMQFILDFCDHVDSTAELICLNVKGYFVKKSDIIDLYVFGNSSWLLYFDEYYKAPEDRTKPDPNIDETKGYYYSPPDPNAPTAIEQIRALIALL